MMDKSSSSLARSTRGGDTAAGNTYCGGARQVLSEYCTKHVVIAPVCGKVHRNVSWGCYLHFLSIIAAAQHFMVRCSTKPFQDDRSRVFFNRNGGACGAIYEGKNQSGVAPCGGGSAPLDESPACSFYFSFMKCLSAPAERQVRGPGDSGQEYEGERKVVEGRMGRMHGEGWKEAVGEVTEAKRGSGLISI